MAQPQGATTSAQQQDAPSLEGMEELYVREADRLEAINGPFGEVMLKAAGLQPGQRVLDVGCGQGTTTREAARAVAPEGAAVGVDISARWSRSPAGRPRRPASATSSSSTPTRRPIPSRNRASTR
jgi:SAM-dependent methyltransferase